MLAPLLGILHGFWPHYCTCLFSGDSFQVVTYGSRAGTFATINGKGRNYTPNYKPTNLTLMAQ